MDSNQNIPTINFDHGQPVPPTNQVPPSKRSPFAWLKYKHSQLSPKQKIAVSVLIILLIVGGGFGIYALSRNAHKSPTSSSSERAGPKDTEPSRLTGVLVPKELNKRPVTGVMIENSLDARPQSGLKSAGVVFEAVAEGGITRFLALYQESRPSYIGPVRSVRPYYLDWLAPFDASIAHVGGAPKALQAIKKYHYRDLDQFFNPTAYRRVPNRAPPHNVYTDMDKLDRLNKQKGYKFSDFTGFARKYKETPLAKPTVTSINIAISSALYNVHYTYKKSSNNYLRSEGGGVHRDAKSGKRLAPKVVIAMVIRRGIASDGQHTNYGTAGSGRAYIFQNGRVTIGIWKKKDRRGQLRFLKSDGSVLELNPGQTWITMVDDRTSVSYKP